MAKNEIKSEACALKKDYSTDVKENEPHNQIEEKNIEGKREWSQEIDETIWD